MSLENPFSKKPILPPEETNPDSNIELIGALLGVDSAEAYRRTIAGETSRPVVQKSEFKLDFFDTFDAETFNTQEIENKLNLTKQYETQRNIFEKIGLLETKEGMLGMTDIEGTWHNFPTLQEISQRLKEKQALVETKMNQGFEKLLIVPFGMSIDKFVETMKKTILAHYVSMPDPTDPEKQIPDPSKTKLWSKNQDGTMEAASNFDVLNPIKVAPEYQQADENGSLVYFPTQFTKENHGGKTKKELLGENQAFHILLLESEIDIPSVCEEKGGRERIMANKTGSRYLEILQEQKEYAGEQGLTPEAWMTLFMLHLEETNQVIDDWSGIGKASHNLGGWFPSSEFVGMGYWSRSYPMVNSDGIVVSYIVADAVLVVGYEFDTDENWGMRSTVMV